MSFSNEDKALIKNFVPDQRIRFTEGTDRISEDKLE